jgi:hypothetical protein
VTDDAVPVDELTVEERIADAHDVAVDALRRIVEAMRAAEGELQAEEEARRTAGSRAELRALRSARMALVDARKALTPAVDRGEARRRAFERQHFDPE